ncbi:GntR family transcriptional regulator [Rhodovastum atsumiense]|uniref:GntR family transcriptional regulator n=1 Tax=Rhodovastum atsumiense TaxID=504468 RepID=UPI001EF01265|nr:GntR family transcriptional regulator [Rhodovastum atsumiense]
MSEAPPPKRRGPRSALAAGAEGAEPIRGRTAATEVYRVLRGEIMSMARKPGEPINDREIEAALGVSRTPIREAILRLAGENLVEVLPQSGTFVARIPLATLPEAIVIRRALEELTVRAAAEHATESQVAGLQASLARQREHAAADDPVGFYAADEAFHAAIAAAAGYPTTWKLVQQVKVQVDRYCHLSLPQPGRMARLLKEHTAIVNAIRAHDPLQAVAALDAHLNNLLAGLVLAPDFDRGYFIGDPSAVGPAARAAVGAGRGTGRRRAATPA